MRRSLILAGLLIGFSACAGSAFAATTLEQQIDDATAQLQSLYQAQEKSKTPSTYSASIDRERAAVRKIFDNDVSQLIDQATALTGATLSARSALDRQQTLVGTLDERLREANVDIDLLNQEEKNVYGGSQWFGTGSTRLTQTHPELLARRAVLQEQADAINAVLPTQQERLNKLQNDQRLEQFSVLFGVLEYVFMILLVVAIERFIRLQVIPKLFNDQVRRYRISKVFAAVVYVTLVISVIARLSADHPSIATSFAIVGAALAVALQDVVKDVLSWIITIQSRRYQIGERISVGQWTGDVIDVSPLRTTILEVATQDGRDLGRTGKTVAVPNMLTLSQPVVNYNTSSDFLRLENIVTITYDSDWKLAKEILLEILDEKTGEYTQAAMQQERRRMRQFYVAEIVHGPSLYTDIGANGITFMLRFYAPVGQHRTLTSEIAEAILERFGEQSPPIELAYNTSRVFATSLDEKDLPRGALRPSSERK